MEDFVNVQIGAADARASDADEHLAWSRRRPRSLDKGQFPRLDAEQGAQLRPSRSKFLFFDKSASKTSV